MRADDKYSADSFEVFHNHPLALTTYLHCCVHYAPQCSIPLRPTHYILLHTPISATAGTGERFIDLQ